MSEGSKHSGALAQSAQAVANEQLTPEPALDHIRDALRDLKYGVVSIIVQDGVVMQIERTEKRRLR
jgi:hypothetical protein